jgi:N utilization substance protein B
MGPRRKAREVALQILYQIDAQGGELPAERALGLFIEHFSKAPQAEGEEPEDTLDEASRTFAAELVRGVREKLDELDAAISAVSRNWRLERMARVDRNLLRMAVYELKHSKDVPAKVVLNEAIEIAKRYGTSESAAFVNGILDRCLPRE